LGSWGRRGESQGEGAARGSRSGAQLQPGAVGRAGWSAGAGEGGRRRAAPAPAARKGILLRRGERRVNREGRMGLWWL